MPTRKIITPEAARLRMADLCSRSEQCEHDIRQKLYRMGLPPSQAIDIIGFLTNNGFIDHARFAKSFTHDKCRLSAWGRNKIKAALSAKKISDSDIAEAFASIDEEEWLDTVKRVATAKARSLDLSDRNDLMKLYRHILSRGFESYLASRAIKELTNR